MEGTWVRKGRAGDAAVVFVHGVLSSGETCWRHLNGTYWPELLACDPALDGFSLYVFTYRTGFFSGSYRLADAVDALKEHMRLDGVFERKRVVFVCHSMGGIVVRKFLVSRAADLIERGTEIGLFLIASPSLGSDYANWLAPLARFLGHGQADALRFAEDNVWLMDLDREFMNLKEGRQLRIFGKELIEDRFVVLRGFWRKQVVEPISGARYFGEPYKVPASDHCSIAKVDSDMAIQHRQLRAFLLEGGAGHVAVGLDRQPASNAELGPPPISKASEYGLGAALQLDRIKQWAAIMEAAQRSGNFLFLYHGSHDQNVQLFVERIRFFFSSEIQQPRGLCRVRFNLQGATPQTGADWIGHLRDGLGCRDTPLAECLASELARQPLFIILGHSPLPAGNLGERQIDALREFITEELPATLARANIQTGIVLLLPFDYLTDEPPPLIHQVTQWGIEAQRTNWLQFRALPRASLPTWEDVVDYLTTTLQPPTPPEQIELIRCEYEERVRNPDLSFDELARIVDSYTQYG